MSGGVIFLVCIPTSNYEYDLLYGAITSRDKRQKLSKHVHSYIENISTNYQILSIIPNNKNGRKNNVDVFKSIEKGKAQLEDTERKKSELYYQSERNRFISMEIILDELLKKLKIEHVVWCKDKAGMYYEVIFPVSNGEPCENCLHCLTKLGIGLRMNSIVNVIPTQCTYRDMNNKLKINEENKQNHNISDNQYNTWDTFTNSIRSKLTVKQVIDGVRSGGDLTFDYILLVLTADCLAALGLIENSATNVVAAMLVSPLMGPVMSLTFGTIILDKKLQSIGLRSLFIGIILSIIFGFIFGLLLGTTEMPWGYTDWPTDEMKGRGNYRSLWMGILWALPSGTGVAVALLQGSNGPLIGVAISASLLPPVVNCGLFWALGCIWLIYQPIKMPHMKGESLTNLNTTYNYIYAEYLPIEFFCNGIISACLTFINVMCIFITAIIVLKIKEVAAPYTSTPELRRFWENDIQLVRDNNIKNNSILNSPSIYDEFTDEKQEKMESMLNAAIFKTINDKTFQNVRRLSYGNNNYDQLLQLFGNGKTLFGKEIDKTMIEENLDVLEEFINHLLFTYK